MQWKIMRSSKVSLSFVAIFFEFHPKIEQKERERSVLHVGHLFETGDDTFKVLSSILSLFHLSFPFNFPVENVCSLPKNKNHSKTFDMSFKDYYFYTSLLIWRLSSVRWKNSSNTGMVSRDSSGPLFNVRAHRFIDASPSLCLSSSKNRPWGGCSFSITPILWTGLWIESERKKKSCLFLSFPFQFCILLSTLPLFYTTPLGICIFCRDRGRGAFYFSLRAFTVNKENNAVIVVLFYVHFTTWRRHVTGNLWTKHVIVLRLQWLNTTLSVKKTDACLLMSLATSFSSLMIHL